MPKKPAAAVSPFERTEERKTKQPTPKSVSPFKLHAPPTGPPGRLFTYQTLREKGIKLHPNYVRQLVNEGKFPRPFYMTERRPAWTEAQIDRWIEERQAGGRS